MANTLKREDLITMTVDEMRVWCINNSVKFPSKVSRARMERLILNSTASPVNESPLSVDTPVCVLKVKAKAAGIPYTSKMSKSQLLEKLGVGTSPVSRVSGIVTPVAYVAPMKIMVGATTSEESERPKIPGTIVIMPETFPGQSNRGWESGAGIRVRIGIEDETFDLAGRSISDALEIISASGFVTIPTNRTFAVNGSSVSETYILRSGDTLDVVKPSRKKGF